MVQIKYRQSHRLLLTITSAFLVQGVIGISASSAAPLTQIDVNFSEISSQVGLGSTSSTGSTVHAPGTIFADLNNDGYPDIYAINNAGNALYINTPTSNGGREFVLAPGAAGANPGVNTSGAAPGDYDNDGDMDLFIAVYNGSNVLYKNMLTETGGLFFQDVTDQTVSGISNGVTQAGLADSFDSDGEKLDNSYTASWSDVNRDGFLDLYVGTHHGQHGNDAPADGLFGMRDTLYLSQGDGTFLDVTEVYNVTGASGPNGETQDSFQQYASTMATMFVDVNNDSWPDLIVTNKTKVRSGPIDTDQLYLNLGDNNQGVWQGFENVTYSLLDGANNPDYSISPMSVAVSDIDNDGDFDFTYSDDSSDEFGSGTPGTNELYVNQLSETGQLGFAIDHTSVPAAFSWGTVFADFDNNGFEDLYVTGANCCTRGFNTPDFLYMNAGGQFTEKADQANIISNLNTDGRANATADFDRDGWPEILQVYTDGTKATLYYNQSAAIHPQRGAVTVKLVGAPNSPSTYTSTLDAMGARATLLADINGDGTIQRNRGESQIREVASGYNVMSTTSSLELEFGMGLADWGTLTVNWPSGRTTSTSVFPGKHYIVNETGGRSEFNLDQTPPPITSNSSFTPCAIEGGTCVLPGPATVRYGADGLYFQLSFDSGNVSCSNEVFGDPIRGTVKGCEYQLTTPTDNFVFCANENNTCVLPGPSIVRYGANGQYFEQSYNGGNVSCSNAEFGDPIRGTVKTCEATALGENLALNKRTTQKTTDFGAAASRAVDGNNSGIWQEDSVTHTQRGGSSNPWWRVDLGARYDVGQINVFNRTDCCNARLNGAVVYVGNTASSNPADYTAVGTLSGSKTMQTLSAGNARGRYVMIRIEGNAILSLAEVEVFSR